MLKDFTFPLSATSLEKTLSNLEGLSPSKAAGIDILSGNFLGDEAGMLVVSISQLFNLSIKLSSFPRTCDIAKVKLLCKKGCKSRLFIKNY